MMSAIDLIPEIEHFAGKTDLLEVNLRPAVELCADRTVGIVIACPDSASRGRLITLLLRKGFEPVLASTLRETILLLEHEEIALVICQTSFHDGDFRELLRAAVRIGPTPPIIVCADWYEAGAHVEAIELGAFDYLTCPFRRDAVEAVVDRALRESMNHERISHKTETVRRKSIYC